MGPSSMVHHDISKTCVPKQPMIALNFESENELKFYNLEAWYESMRRQARMQKVLLGRRMVQKLRVFVLLWSPYYTEWRRGWEGGLFLIFYFNSILLVDQ